MNRPVPLTREDLAATLREMGDLVEARDSFEGNIEYLMPDPDDDVPEDTYAMVRAVYRVGNTMGQGGYRVIADYDESFLSLEQRLSEAHTVIASVAKLLGLDLNEKPHNGDVWGMGNMMRVVRVLTDRLEKEMLREAEGKPDVSA